MFRGSYSREEMICSDLHQGYTIFEKKKTFCAARKESNKKRSILENCHLLSLMPPMVLTGNVPLIFLILVPSITRLMNFVRMVEWVGTVHDAREARTSLPGTSGPPPDHIHLVRLTGLIWTEGLACCRYIAGYTVPGSGVDLPYLFNALFRR